MVLVITKCICICLALASMIASGDTSETEIRSLEEALEELIRLEDEISREAQKKDFTTLVMGNTGAGKSTTVAQLLYSSPQSGIDKTAFANYLTQAPSDRKFAWALEKLAGQTNNVEGKWTFETTKYKCIALDVAGFASLLQARVFSSGPPDCAIIVVSAASNEYELGMGDTGHTREDIRLAFRLGIKQIIVAVNKMDAQGYSKERFEEIKTKLRTFLSEVGYDSSTVPFIPISAFNGDNLLALSQKMSWYQDRTLVGALDAMVPSKPMSDRPLRLPIMHVYKSPGVGTFIKGRVETGIITRGMTVRIAPVGIQTEARSITMYHEDIPEARPGDNVQVVLKGVSVRELSHGLVIGDASNDPPKDAVSFQALITLSPTARDIQVGYIASINVHVLFLRCSFEELIERYDRETGRVLASTPARLSAGDIALVKLKPVEEMRMAVEPFGEYPPLGRFALRDVGTMVATGFITKVETKDGPIKIIRRTME